jgi:hypothetical protein
LREDYFDLLGDDFLLLAGALADGVEIRMVGDLDAGKC